MVSAPLLPAKPGPCCCRYREESAFQRAVAAAAAALSPPEPAPAGLRAAAVLLRLPGVGYLVLLLLLKLLLGVLYPAGSCVEACSCAEERGDVERDCFRSSSSKNAMRSSSGFSTAWGGLGPSVVLAAAAGVSSGEADSGCVTGSVLTSAGPASEGVRVGGGWVGGGGGGGGVTALASGGEACGVGEVRRCKTILSSRSKHLFE